MRHFFPLPLVWQFKRLAADSRYRYAPTPTRQRARDRLEADVEAVSQRKTHSAVRGLGPAAGRPRPPWSAASSTNR